MANQPFEDWDSSVVFEVPLHWNTSNGLLYVLAFNLGGDCALIHLPCSIEYPNRNPKWNICWCFDRMVFDISIGWYNWESNLRMSNSCEMSIKALGSCTVVIVSLHLTRSLSRYWVQLIFDLFSSQAQTPSKDEKKRKADGTPDGRGRKKKKQ